MRPLSKVASALSSLLHRARGTALSQAAERLARAPGASEPLGPGEPVQPREPRGSSPRAWIYPPGVNIALAPRAIPGLVSFQELRNFAASYDVLRVCLETRKQQLRGLKWDVVVRDPAKTRGSDFSNDIERAVAFFRHPDGRLPFSTWLNAALEDALVIDALTIYKRRDRRGRLLALELVDGATIKPIVDDYGRTPEAPAPAYQQFAYGFPWAEFARDEILYRAYNPRSFINYGYSPTEQIIVTVTIGLAREIAAINHYKEGNTPAGFGEVPKEWTAGMIREFEEIFNGLLAGDFAARSRIKMVPAGFNFKPWIDSGTTFNPTYDEYLTRIVCAAFGIPPTQFIRTFNRATAEVVDDATTASGLDPLKEFVEQLFDEILVSSDGLNMPHLRFSFISDRRQDEELELRKNIEYLKAGVLSIDDVLVRLGMEPIGVGRFVAVSGQGLVPLENLFRGEFAQEEREDPALAHTVAALSDQERTDLGKWMRKARRAVAKLAGNPSGAVELSFESDFIRPDRRERIQSALEAAGTVEQVNAIFAAELESGGENTSVPAVEPSQFESEAGSLANLLDRVRQEIAATVLARSGISKEGFSRARHLYWLHDRAPHSRDLLHRRSEYFDAEDLEPLTALAEPLAHLLSMHISSSAGTFDAALPKAAKAHSGPPGAHPPYDVVRIGVREDTESLAAGIDPCEGAAMKTVIYTAAITRARLNRLIDYAHEHELSQTELCDAVMRARDFSALGARSLIQAASAEFLKRRGSRRSPGSCRKDAAPIESEMRSAPYADL
jgi:Phage portal protein